MSDINDKIGEINRAFEEFKSKQDTVIAEEIKKGTADVVRKTEVDAINADITKLSDELKQLELKAARPGAADESTAAKAEHKAAFNQWMRKGREEGLSDLEAKALNVTTSADGGFAVPEELDRSVLDLIKQISPVRQFANVITVGTSDYKKLVNVRGTASGWVGETSARTETNTPQLAEVAAVMGEVYANPMATQRMLDDAFFDAEGWLAAEIATEFAQAEANAFISGNGTNRPRGFLNYTINTSADGARAFGDLQMVRTGVAGAFIATTTSANPADTFIDVVHSMKSELRAGAAWMMNTLTLAAVRKFKDADGAYIWRPGLESGQPSTILGYAVAEAPGMPDVATNTFPIAFGNWQRGYTVVDRIGTRVLRDPYTNKPYVGFYATKRVGGMVVDSEAIKILATRV